MTIDLYNVNCHILLKVNFKKHTNVESVDINKNIYQNGIQLI